VDRYDCRKTRNRFGVRQRDAPIAKESPASCQFEKRFFAAARLEIEKNSSTNAIREMALQPDEAAENEQDRRDFLSRTAPLAMAGGLVAGYGSLGYYAGCYLLSQQRDVAWQFVRDVQSFLPGDSMSFESPTGVKVTITRRQEQKQDGAPQQATSDDFQALSSVCPHLGCRVHWEAQNNRFFCPCHNGTFDPHGKATGGPPKAANQELPRYPVKVENGMLFIEMPLDSVGRRPGQSLEVTALQRSLTPGDADSSLREV
jgi:Rieske Fe-S protein